MWEKIIDFLKNIFTFTYRLDRHEKEIDRLQQENKKLSDTIHHQQSQIDVLVYALQSENDKTRMWVEKELVKFERRLPSGEGKKDDDKKN